MRVGYRVLDNGVPVEGAIIVGNLWPPVLRTDANGEAFGVAPFAPAMLPAIAPFYNPITVVFKGGKFIASSDIVSAIEAMYVVDLGTQTRTRDALSVRIPGDGFFQVDQEPLRAEEVMVIPGDRVLSVSSCGKCLYLERVSSNCLVNGPASPIPIPQPSQSTSRLYYPFFLPPSPQRVKRDLSRMSARA